MKSLLLPIIFLTLFMASQARADEWNKKTIVTFSGTVQMPGSQLNAGTYEFKLLDDISTRHIVQIFNSNGTRLINTVMAIPNWRLQPTGKTVILYGERRADEPPAVEAWFYPGDNFGQQFVYPRNQAAELSRLNNTSVPSSGNDETAAAPPATPAPEEAMNNPAQPEAAPAPTESAEAATPEPAPEPSVQPQANTSAAPATLPQTASELPLVGFAGIMLLYAALGIRAFSRRGA